MKLRLFRCLRCLIFRAPWIAVLWAAGGSGLPAAPADLSAGILWSGSWDLTGNLVNRGDLRLKALGLEGRAQALLKHPPRFWEEPDRGITAFSGGLYHNRTGSRLLYGVLDAWGLPARLRNPWGKSVPFADAHKASGGDLKTETSATRNEELYLYLGSPRLGPFRGYVSAQIDPEGSQAREGAGGLAALGSFAPAFSGGLEAGIAKKVDLRLDWFDTGKRLPPYRPASWFSEKPPLPERDFHLTGIGLFFTAPFLALAVDGARSETFAWGQDWYGNLALRVGEKPWRVSLGAEAGGNRYVDRDGTAVGAGFRTAAAFEWKGTKSSLLRITATLRAPALGDPFNRSAAGVYYHFPNHWGIQKPILIRPVKISLGAARNAQDPEAIEDSLEGALGFGLGPVQGAFRTVVKGIAAVPAPETGHDAPVPVPPAPAYRFDSATVSGELFWSPGPFQFRVKVGYTGAGAGEPVWDTGFSAAIRGKPGRFSVKVSSPDFPSSWTCALSWRLSLQAVKKGPVRK